MLIRNVTVHDGTAGPDEEPVDVVVDQGTFASIVPTGQPRPDSGAPDTHVIDGTGAYLVPGLWESHTHLSGFAKAQAADERLPYLRENLRMYAASGITTVCDLGGDLDLEVSARSELADDATSATLKYAGPCFTSVDGWPIALHHDHQMAYEVRDAIAAREYAESIIGRVNYLKCIFDGKPGAGDRVSVEVLRGLADVAHEHCKKLLVHVASGADVRDALSAGVDCVEHSFVPEDAGTLDEAREIADLFAASGTLFCPTLVTWEQLHRGNRTYLDELVHAGLMTDADADSVERRPGFGRPFPHHPVDEARVRFEYGMRALPIFVAAGVRLVAGSDVALTMPTADKALFRELQLFALAGVPNAEILRSVTGHAAQKIGSEHRYGTITEGAPADALLLNTDPSTSIDALFTEASVRMVLHAGVPIVSR